MFFPPRTLDRIVVTALLLRIWVPVAFPVWGQDASVQAETAQATAVLASDASREAKLNACRRLAAIGGQESITALAALLADDELSHAARIGLEAIPDPAAGEALRKALNGLDGGPLIGVINSLGTRRDVSAAQDLGRYLTDADPQVVAAAGDALGKIASPEALTLLENALPQVAEELRPALANACLRGVTALRQQGLNDEAARICHLLRAAHVPSHIHNAATRQAILACPAEAAPLLEELLLSSDRRALDMALTVSRELESSEITRALIDSLPTLPPPRQELVIMALGDRGDPAAREALVRSASSPDVPIRAATLRALGRTGDVSTVPLLLAVAGDAEPEIAAAARQALSELEGDDVDAAIAAALATSAVPLRRILIDLVGARRIRSAAADLIPWANERDEATRLAALSALGQVIDASELSVLTARLLAPASPEELATVRAALLAACRRPIDKDTCTRELRACLTQAELDTAAFLIELLAVVGGPAALETVASSATAPQEVLQDVATRVLGQWRTPDVAPVLIELARTLPEEKYRIRSLRGALRVIRQMDLPDGEKLALLRQALDAATRPEEQILAVEALGRISTVESLEEAVQHVDREELRETACAATVTIAERIAPGQGARVAEPMQRVVAASTDPELVRRAQAVLASTERSP